MRAVLIALAAVVVTFAALGQLAPGSHADDGCTAGGPLAIAVPGLAFAIGDAGTTVLPGARCDLSGLTVTGSIAVAPGGTLIASGATISGSIAADSPAALTINGTTIAGSVAVQASTGDIALNGDEIDADLTLTGNLATTTLTGTSIAGDVAIVQDSGVLNVAGNSVGGAP